MAGPNALTTITDVKLYLHIDPADTIEDAFLDRLIDIVTAQIEKYTKRKLKNRTLTELYDGSGTAHQILREFPITVLTEVNIDPGQDFLPGTAVTPLGDFIIRSDEEGRISFKTVPPTGASSLSGAGLFPFGTKNVKVIYDAGFTVIPEDINLATIKTIAAHFHRSREGADGTASESLGTHSITWIDGLPEDVVELLREHRRTF